MKKYLLTILVGLFVETIAFGASYYGDMDCGVAYGWATSRTNVYYPSNTKCGVVVNLFRTHAAGQDTYGKVYVSFDPVGGSTNRSYPTVTGTYTRQGDNVFMKFDLPRSGVLRFGPTEHDTVLYIKFSTSRGWTPLYRSVPE